MSELKSTGSVRAGLFLIQGKSISSSSAPSSSSSSCSSSSSSSSSAKVFNYLSMVAHTPVILGLGRLRSKGWASELHSVSLSEGREGRRNRRKDKAEESSVSRRLALQAWVQSLSWKGGDRWTPVAPWPANLISKPQVLIVRRSSTNWKSSPSTLCEVICCIPSLQV